MVTRSKSSRSDRNHLVIAGVKKHLANATSIIIGGTSYAPVDIEKIFQDPIDARDATATTTAAFHKAVAAEKAANAKGDALYRGLRKYLTNQYETQPDVLADFGIALQTKQVPDANTVAAAVAKRAATRTARHTMGKRQKQGVKGTVTPTAPATSAAATAPTVQSQGTSAPTGASAAAAPRNS
jgi:hypothetical protein